MRYIARLPFVLAVFAVCALEPVAAQSRADLDFRFVNQRPAYGAGQGPLVCMDVGHNDFQTEQIPGALQPFTTLLASDGFKSIDIPGPLTQDSLAKCKVLVIARAFAAENAKGKWKFPHNSAFSSDELEAIFQWTRAGGGLFLIAHHAPAPGAVSDLATMLGAALLDGSARLKNQAPSPNLAPLPDVFTREAGMLGNHPILRGRDASETIDHVAAWSGAAFKTSREWSPLLTYGSDSVAWVALGVFPSLAKEMPREQWPYFAISGWAFAATRSLDRGRVALLAGVNTCTAVVDSDGPTGMNHPEGNQNAQFCLNTVRWLSGVLKE
jgi:hypothetical protein